MKLFHAALPVFSGAADVAAAGPRLNNNQLYKFSYTTEVLLDKARGSKEGSAGYRISSDVKINLVWRDPSNKDDQLIQLAVCGIQKSLAHFFFLLSNKVFLHNKNTFDAFLKRYLSLTDLKCGDWACVREEWYPSWIHNWEHLGEKQTSSSNKTFPGTPEKWEGENINTSTPLNL